MAVLELNSEIFEGKDVHSTKLRAKTTGMVDALYKVIDIYESYIDPAY